MAETENKPKENAFVGWIDEQIYNASHTQEGTLTKWNTKREEDMEEAKKKHAELCPCAKQGEPKPAQEMVCSVCGTVDKTHSAYCATHGRSSHILRDKQQPSRTFSEGDVEKVAVGLFVRWYMGMGEDERRETALELWERYDKKRRKDWYNDARSLLASLHLKPENEVREEVIKEIQDEFSKSDYNYDKDDNYGRALDFIAKLRKGVKA